MVLRGKVLYKRVKVWYESVLMNTLAWKEQIEDVLKIIGRVSGQGAVYHAREDAVLQANARVCAFCRYALDHATTRMYCRYACHGGAIQTLSSGEPAYQRCWAGLLTLSVAVKPRGTYLGGISCGGFFAEEEAEEVREHIRERLRQLPGLHAAPFLARIPSLQPISPGALRGLGELLLETTFSCGVNSPASFRKAHERYEAQRRIADSFASIREPAAEPPDFMRDTHRLFDVLRAGERDAILQGMSDYLARLLMMSQWNLTRLRAHVRVLVAMITSQQVLEGMDWTAAMRRELVTMSGIEKHTDVESICSEVADLVLTCFGRANQDAPAREYASLSDRVLAWLQAHVQESATIREAAYAVGASVSTLARHLPRETGKTYRQLRKEVRIAEAKRLLATTDMEISAIADRCGFTDQSHFTRVMREEISLTPGRFRALLVVPGSGQNAGYGLAGTGGSRVE